ncbi:MAG: hypothetical protein ACOCRO_08710 [Halanaerobiales bacterium]
MDDYTKINNEAERAFKEGTYWQRANKYKIVNEEWSTGINVKLIVPTKESIIEEYNPLDYCYINEKPPTLKKKRSFNTPNRHLASLTPYDEEEALEFINKWGLLGLWKVNDYKDRGPFDAPIKPLTNYELGPNYSKWYIYSKYEHLKNFDHRKKYCEPLDVFFEATIEYQKILEKIEETKDSEFAEYNLKLDGCTMRSVRMNGKVVTIWQCDSLLHWIHLLTQLEHAAGYEYRVCANYNCNIMFTSNNPNRKYCSKRCKDTKNKTDQLIREGKRRE